MSQEQAFRTDDPAVLAAFHEAVRQREEGVDALLAATAKLGKNKGPKVSRGIWGLKDELIGLYADDPADPPEGWRYLKSWGGLRPRRGKPGLAAQEFLDRHRYLGNDPLTTLFAHGLVPAAYTPMADGRTSVNSPAVFEHDGALYAKYRGSFRRWPGTEENRPTWPQIPLSEYHAAYERAHADQDDGADDGNNRT